MAEPIIVYHGGTEAIADPLVNAGRAGLDFGRGFYVTDLFVQAKDWAERMANIRSQQPIVSEYILNKGAVLQNCRTKIFEAYDREWLDFVAASRLGQKVWQGYDYIEGGIANDRVVDTIRLYMNGFISAEDALGRLRYFKPTNQICILNQQVINKFLIYTGFKAIMIHD